jgi:cell wall-associated NlpC family hydrolase
MNATVQAARSYLGTPFHHQARLKGLGVDCVGLVICVARALSIVAPGFDVGGYQREPDGHSLLRHLSERLLPVARADMAPGDVVCVAFDNHPDHVGFLGDYPGGGLSIIHASSKHGRVVETRLMFTPDMRFVSAFRFPQEVAHG